MKFTPEEITGMAREASSSDHLPWNGQWIFQSKKELIAFVTLVAEKAAAKEREAIAAHYDAQPHMEFFGRELADEIRARGEKEAA